MNPMEILSSTLGVESPGKVQSEEETPAAGFLALLGLEVEASSPNLKPSVVEIEEGDELEVSTHLTEGKKQMSGPEENWGGVPLSYIGKRNAAAKEKVLEVIPETDAKTASESGAVSVQSDLPEEVPVEKSKPLAAPVVSENAPVVSDGVENGCSTVSEAQDAAVPTEMMVHRIPPMHLKAVETLAERQSNLVKAVEPKIGMFGVARSKTVESASLLAGTAPQAMMLKSVPLRVEEVVAKMVPVADVQIKREDSVLKPVVAQVAPAGIEAVPTKVVSAPTVPPPMNLPSAPTMNETTMRLEQLSNQFDQRLLSMVQQNEKVMRITMEPATMGKMTVLCREENASLTIEIHVQHPAVRELIARQEEDIRRVMQECNVAVGGFDVLMSEQHNEQRQSSFDRSDSRGEFHGIAPASKEAEGVGETPVYFRRNAASWVA